MPRTIGFLGSLALVVSGLTGPSLAVIPLLYQEAGWLTPLMAFALVAFLSGSATLFIIEAMTSIEGNKEFQASIEFTTIAHLFIGKRWHWAVQIVLYVALQTLIITSLIESFQSMDSLLISVAHKTCAVSFEQGWICAKSMLADGNGVFSDYILFSFGTLITFAMVLPLSLIHLTENIKFQIASFILLLCITVIWLATCIQVGLHNISVPVAGSNQSNVVGFVLSNFAFVTTVPAWINNTHPSVNIRLVVWLSLVIVCLIYIPIGWMGAAAFTMDSNSTILNVLASDRPNIIALISTYLFPVAVLITSVPVFAIVVRYNLLRGNICSNRMAIFLSAILPWLIAIPFQTRGWIAIILNWTSLVFSCPANLLIPFFLYLVSKRYKASALLDANVYRQPSLANRSSMVGSVPLPEMATVDNTPLRPLLPVLLMSDENLKTEADDYVRLVRSPSRHRYYGQTSTNDASDPLSDSPPNQNETNESDVFRSGPAGPSSPRSLPPISAGTDEFRLAELPLPMSVVAPVRDRRRSTVPAIAEDPEELPTILIDPVLPQPAFEAFPFLHRSWRWSWCTPSRVAVVECSVTLLLVVAAFMYNIIKSVKGHES